ncbi:hypothetical protein N4R57_19840 [Rhodobacteraceae bacterium D3-12]|nr:hypothetical protein N4R57_19840 [Rhodobacteraceae bacterium D3-12]
MEPDATLPDNIILHVGQPKAGSTAIQNALDANRDALLEQGVLFPRSVLRRSNPADPSRTPGHLDLLGQLAKKNADSFEVELKKHAARTNKLVLSVENITLLGAHDPKVSALASRLTGSNVKIIAVHRDAYEWYQAYYYECVVGGIRNTVEPVASHLADVTNSDVLDFSERIQELAKVFNATSVTILPFASDDGTTLLERFLEAAGLDLPEATTLSRRRVNVSFTTRPVVETHRWLNLFLGSMSREESLRFSQDMKAFYNDLLLADSDLRSIPLLGTREGANLKQAIGTNDPATVSNLPPRNSATYRPAKSESAAMVSILEKGLDTIALRSGGLQLANKNLNDVEGAKLWSVDELRLLMKELTKASSICVHGDATALAVAAGAPGRMVLGLCPTTEQVIPLQAMFDSLQAASPVLVRNYSTLPATLTAVDLVVLGEALSDSGALSQLKPGLVILRVTAGQPVAPLPKAWNAQLCARVGGLRIYRAGEHTKSKREATAASLIRQTN